MHAIMHLPLKLELRQLLHLLHPHLLAELLQLLCDAMLTLRHRHIDARGLALLGASRLLEARRFLVNPLEPIIVLWAIEYGVGYGFGRLDPLFLILNDELHGHLFRCTEIGIPGIAQH